MARGDTYEGRECHHCGSTTRSVATKRCLTCNIRWKNASVAHKEERAARVGMPCDICADPMAQPNRDEDPKTHATRGWLCAHCNRGLGMLREDPKIIAAAWNYITRSEYSLTSHQGA